MKNLYHYLSNIEKSRTSLQEGQSIDFVLNEEYSIRTDIVAVDGRDVYVGLDRRAYELLERAGVIEAEMPGTAKPGQINLAQSNKTMSGAARPNAPVANPAAAKPAAAKTSTTPAAAAAAPAPGGARNPAAGTAATAQPYKGSTGAQSIAQASGIKDVNKIQAGQKLTLPGGGSYTVQKGDTMDKIAKQTGGGAATPQGDQTAGGKTNADFLPGAAGGAQPDAMTGADAGNQTSSGYNAQSQAQKTPAAAGQRPGGIAFNQDAGATSGQAATATTTVPQSNTFGVQPQANIPGSPTGTSTAAPATATSSLPITTTGGPTAANPASVNPPTQGGPAVTGGFGQQTNISQDSDDVIAKRTPYGQQNQATKSYSSVGDFAGAVGNKVKGMFGGGSTPAAPTDTSNDINEGNLDRVLQLAGVKRG
jgi:LysM repeat protein